MSLRTSSVKNHSSDDEKAQPNYGAGVVEPYEDPLEENEVFKKTKEGVDFRTVGWPRASVIFLKGMQSSTSRSYTYLQVSSHLCDRGAQHPFSNVQLGSLGRRTQCRRLGSFEYVHSRCARRFPKFPSRMSLHRRHGSCAWWKRAERGRRCAVPHSIRLVCRVRNPRCIDRSQRSFIPCCMHCLVVIHRDHRCSGYSLCQEVPSDRLAHMGRFHQHFFGSFYRGCGSHYSRSPCCGSSDWGLRSWLPCHRTPDIHCWHDSFSYYLCLFRRHFGVLASHF